MLSVKAAKLVSVVTVTATVLVVTATDLLHALSVSIDDDKF